MTSSPTAGPPTAAEIVDAVRSGTATARAAVEQALERIAALDPPLRAFRSVLAPSALRAADDVDARPDRASLPLAGVPIAVSADLEPAIAPDDGVARLRAAGAIVVGTTVTSELGLFATTDSTSGITRNPWDPTRTPGGSSGGAATAVAAGMVPIALGFDAVGSVRITAASCGVVGSKPGAGVAPAGGDSEAWSGLAEVGVLATSVEDTAIVLAALADRPGLARRTSPGLLRIAVSTTVPMTGVSLDAPWAGAAVDTADLLRGLGHTVRRIDPPYGHLLVGKELTRWTVAAARLAHQVGDDAAFERRTRRHAALGRLAIRAGLPRENGRLRWQKRVERFFADLDLLVTPALARFPPAAGPWSHIGWLRNVATFARYAPFAAPWNLAGWPALTVPVGLGANGLPLAVQLVGKPGAESQLVHVARQVETARPWPRVVPSQRR